MGEFKDRVSGTGKEGYRNLEVIDAETSGLTNGTTFKAKVQFDDDATENGTPFAKSNIATASDNKDMAQGDKVVTADNIASEFTKRKRLNLLPDIIARVDSVDEIVNVNSTTPSLDTGNQVVGKSCLKVTFNSATTGGARTDKSFAIDNTKYYFARAKIHSVDVPSTYLRVTEGGEYTEVKTSEVNTTTGSYQDLGVILTPDDLTGLSSIEYYIRGISTSASQVLYADCLSFMEISAYEAGLGVTTLLSQLPWTSSKGIETYDNVISLPSEDNMSNGRCDAIIEGQSNVNLPEDDVAGCESTSGWTTTTTALATDSSNELEGTNCLELTISASNGKIGRDTLSLLDTSKYYLYTVHVKNVNFSTGMRLIVDCNGDAESILSSYSTATYWKRVGVVIQPTDFDTATSVFLEIQGVGSSTQSGYVDAISIHEITTEDYNNASTNGVDVLFDKYPYHRGLKGTEGVEVDSKGKNLLDVNYFKTGTNESSYYTTDDEDLIVIGDDLRTETSDYIPIEVKPNTEYTISVENETTRLNVYEVNSKGEGLDNKLAGATTDELTFTSGNSSFVGFRFREGSGYPVNLGKIQLELGSSATTYEPFKNSKASMPVGLALYSVPNGVRSSFNMNTGVEDKRVELHTLLSGDIDSVANGSNLQRAVIGLDALSGIITQTTGQDLTTLLSGLLGEASGYDTVGDEGKWYTDASNLYILDSLGTWADVSAARTALAGTIIHYELETPVTTYHQPQELQSFTNGTLYKNQQQTETLVYDSGLTLLSGLTPTSCVNMVKLDLDNDTETSVDISDVTVGTPTTISSANDGEVYKYTYRHTGATTGRLQYMYNLNTKDQVNGNSDGLRDMQRQIDYINDKLNNTSDWVTLSDYTVTGSGDSQIDIDLSAVNYTHCRLLISNAISSTTTTRNLNMQFNTDTGSNYNHASYNLNGTSAASGTGTTSISIGNNLLTTNTTPSSGGFAEVLIFNTDSGDRKTVKIDCMYSGGTTSGIRTTGAGTWINTADSIDTIELKPTADSIGVGTRIIVEVRRVK